MQFYINGVAVGAPVELAKLLSQTDADGYAYRTASVTLNFTQGGYPAIPSRPDGKFVIEAKHYGSTNYTDSEGTAIELDGADLPGGGLPTTDPPEVSIKPGQPGEPEKDGNGEDKPGTGTLQPEDKPHQGEDGLVHQNYKDVVYEKVENVTLTQAEVEELVNGRYNIPAGSNVSVVIKDSTGKEVTGLDKSRVTHYTIEVVVTDAEGNSTTVHLRYQLYEEGTTPPAPGGSGEKGNPKTSV